VAKKEVINMTVPKTEYHFDLVFPPAPGSEKQVRLRGEKVSRELTSEAIFVYANEVVARRRESEQHEKKGTSTS
jgi:hypothetical protein